MSTKTMVSDSLAIAEMHVLHSFAPSGERFFFT